MTATARERALDPTTPVTDLTVLARHYPMEVLANPNASSVLIETVLQTGAFSDDDIAQALAAIGTNPSLVLHLLEQPDFLVRTRIQRADGRSMWASTLPFGLMRRRIDHVEWSLDEVKELQRRLDTTPFAALQRERLGEGPDAPDGTYAYNAITAAVKDFLPPGPHIVHRQTMTTAVLFDHLTRDMGLWEPLPEGLVRFASHYSGWLP